MSPEAQTLPPTPTPPLGGRKDPARRITRIKGSMGDVAALGKWSGDKATKPSLGPKGSELPGFPLALAPSPAGLTPRALQTLVQQQNAAQPLAAPDGPKLGGRAQQTGV